MAAARASAPGIQIIPDGHRELPRVAVEPGLGGQGRGGEQDVMLGIEPGQCLLVASQVLVRNARLRRCDAQRRARRIDQHGGGVRGMEVVVEHPGNGRPQGGIAVEGVS